MEPAGVAQLKARLGEYLSRVKAGEGAASLRVPVVLAAQEHYPLPAGPASEDYAIRKLQLRDTLHMNPLPMPLRTQVRTSSQRAHRQPP